MATASPQYAADPNLKKLLVNQQLGAGGVAPTDYASNTSGPTKQPPVEYPTPTTTSAPGPPQAPMTDPYGGASPVNPNVAPGPAQVPMTDPNTPDPNVADGHAVGPLYATGPTPAATPDAATLGGGGSNLVAPSAPTTPVPTESTRPSRPDSPPSGPTAANGYNGNTYLSAIAATMLRAYGRTPTDAEVNAWGSDIDYNYFNKIATAILQSAEAKAFAAKSAAPTTPPTTPPVAGQDWSTGDWDAARVNTYFASRNVTPQPGSAEYWAQKWQEFGKNDPAYFLARLSKADEFTGGPGGAGGQPAYAQNPTSPFTDDIRKILLDRIAKDSSEFDPNSPQISVPMAGAQLQQDRAQEQQRRQLGERLFAGGDLNSGTMGQQNQQASEIGAAALGTMRSTLISKEIDARRTDLTNLLQMAVQSGDADLARQVSLAIANLNAMVAREGQGWDAAKYAAGQTAATTKAGTGN